MIERFNASDRPVEKWMKELESRPLDSLPLTPEDIQRIKTIAFRQTVWTAVVSLLLSMTASPLLESEKLTKFVHPEKTDKPRQHFLDSLDETPPSANILNQ
jgi:hypothetical protein